MNKLSLKDIINNNNKNISEDNEYKDAKILNILKKDSDNIRNLIDGFKINDDLYNWSQLNYINCIIFGPTGSGKSSLIKTLLTSFQDKNIKNIDISDYFIIKSNYNHEGTKKLLKCKIKNFKNKCLYLNNEKIYFRSTGIHIYDTRGHIFLDDKEIKQLELILNGKIKNNSDIINRNFRYSYLLWEFWKKDSELFPEEILKSKSYLKSRPHSVIFTFDGSLENIPSSEEETIFYLNSFNLLYKKNFKNIIIVLTKLDILEAKVEKWALKNKISDLKKEEQLKKLISLRIEVVSNNLKIPKSNIFFIENIHQENEFNSSISYYSLSIITKIMEFSKVYLENLKIDDKKFCKIF